MIRETLVNAGDVDLDVRMLRMHITYLFIVIGSKSGETRQKRVSKRGYRENRN